MATIGWDSDLMRDASDKALEKADNMESNFGFNRL